MKRILARTSVSGLIFDVSNYIFMVIFSISILFPFWDMLVTSFSNPTEAVSLTLRLWPVKWRLDSYIFAFSDNKIIMAYVITIYRTIAGTLLYIILSLLAAYPLSKRDLKFRNVLTIIFIIPMFFSGGLIPSYIINRQLGFVDSLLVYIIPSALSVFTVLLVRNYIMSIDKALEESALIDGAGYFRILFSIILPVSKPIIATIALWSMVGQWNSWFDCLIYIRDEKKIVLQIIIRRMMDMITQVSGEMQEFARRDPTRQVASKTVQAAVTLITIGPIVLSYPFLQKYFVKGIMIGSLKG